VNRTHHAGNKAIQYPKMQTMRPRTIIATLLAPVIAHTAAAQYAYNTIAQSGQQAPGLEDGVQFVSFPGAPVINRNGDVVFVAMVAGPGVTEANNEGIWIRRNGARQFLVIEGMTAPGTAGVFGGELIQSGARSFAERVEFNNNGHTAFRASITGDESDVGVWRHDTDTDQIRLLMRAQDPVPRAPDASFITFGGPFAVSESGLVSFRATLESTDPEFPPFSVGVFVAEPGFADLVAADGVPPPDSPLPGDIDDLGNLNNHTPLTNIDTDPFGRARTVFSALFIPDVPGAEQLESIWAGGQNQETKRLINAGQPAPGTIGIFVKNVFQPFTTFTTNAAGEFVFRAEISIDSNDGDAELSAIYGSDVSGTPTPLFIEGPAPGFIAGVMMAPIQSGAVNANSQTVFAGSLSGSGVSSTNDRTLWAIPVPGQPPVLLAREDDPAPGTFGRRFDNLPATVCINNIGTTAFVAGLTSTGFGAPDGIFATDPANELYNVLFEGQFVDFDGDGLNESVSSVSMRSTPAGDEDGMGSPLHDDGRVVFIAFFDDFSTRVLEAIPDADGDGLWDIWEQNGIDINADGTIDLDLPAMGADPQHKDLFVEVDAMSDFIPDPTAGQMLIDAFANAPVQNPDEAIGINLHFVTDASSASIFVDEDTLPTIDFPNTWEDADDGTPGFDSLKATHFGTTAERADPNWNNAREARRLAVRYCIFGKTYDNSATSAGLAEMPGDDFMVTLGPLKSDETPAFPDAQGQPGGTPEDQAGIFMHELGHNLGLDHGGADGVNLKPNYYSIMNYLWTRPAGPPNGAWRNSWRLDYSRREFASLDESALDEPLGVMTPIDCAECFGAVTPYDAAPLGQRELKLGSLSPTDGVDWDGDGAVSGTVRRDPNSLSVKQPGNAPQRDGTDPGSPDQILTGHDDWSNLRYALAGPADFAEGIHANDTADDEYDVVTVELMESIASALCPTDLNGDGLTDTADLGILISAFGASDPTADLNDDNIVDTADLGVLIGAFGQPCD